MKANLMVVLGIFATLVALAHGDKSQKATLNGETWTYFLSDESVIVNDVETHRDEVRIPDMLDGKKVVGLAAHAFMFNTDGIQSLYLPSSVTNVGVAAGRFCTLRQFCVDPSNPAYKAVDGLLYTRDGTVLLRVPAARTSVVVPEGVTRISAHAFYECPDLVAIELPTSLRTIDEYAFSRCPKLERLELKGQVRTLRGCVIDDCVGLRELVLPDGMEEIGDRVAGGCRSLKTVCIPSSVKRMGIDPFLGVQFGRMYFEGSAPEIGYVGCGDKFRPRRDDSVNVNDNWIVYVRDGACGWPMSGLWYGCPIVRLSCEESESMQECRRKELNSGLSWEYVVDGQGATVMAVEPYPSGVVKVPSALGGFPVARIGSMAFSDRRRPDRFDLSSRTNDLKVVMLPNSVAEIGRGAFNGCDGLRFVLFGGDVPRVDPRAFRESSYLSFYAFSGSKGWPKDGFLHGHEVIRIPQGTDFAAIAAEENRYPYIVGECRNVAVDCAALRAGCELPEFEFGDDYPVKIDVKEGDCWPSCLECIERSVRVDRPLLDLGIHRVHLWRDNCLIRHVWIRNEVRYPIDRTTRIAEYEAIKTAIKQRYGVLGTETKSAAFFSAKWKTVFETDDVRIEVVVDPDGLSRPLMVVATDVERERKMNEAKDGRVDIDTAVLRDDMRTGWGKTLIADYLNATKRGSGLESRWPFDGLPFGKDIDSLEWKCEKTAAKNEIMATEDFDRLGLGISQVYAYADGESKKIFRFVATEDLSLEAYSNVCQMITDHYGVRGVENNEYSGPYGWRAGRKGSGAGSGSKKLTKARTEFALPNQTIRLEWVEDWTRTRFQGKRFIIEIDDAKRFAALREAFRKRYENDRLEKFSFGEVRNDIDRLDECRVVPYDQHARIKKPFRLFGRERVGITPTTHRVWCRTWYGVAFPGWMTKADISNELQCLEKELVRLYGGSPTQEWGHAVLHASGCTFKYGTGECLGIEGSAFCGFGDKNRMVLSVSDDALEKVRGDEAFIDGYEMDKFVFGRNPPKIRVGIGTEFDFDGPGKRWTGRTETFPNTDIVCRHVWTFDPKEFTAVGCCHLGDIGRAMLETNYRRSKIIIGKTYGIANPQETVTTNGVVETSVCTFRQGDLTVTVTKTCEISGKEKTRSLTVVGEMDAEKLQKAQKME